jgi:hypothetical protein
MVFAHLLSQWLLALRKNMRHFMSLCSDVLVDGAKHQVCTFVGIRELSLINRDVSLPQRAVLTTVVKLRRLSPTLGHRHVKRVSLTETIGGLVCFGISEPGRGEILFSIGLVGKLVRSGSSRCVALLTKC